MAQTLGITYAVFFLAKIFDGSFSQISIAGVHRDYAIFYFVEQDQRIFAGEDGVAGVVIYAEVGVMDLIDQIAEDIGLLGEFGVLPVIVFVMIFEN